MSLTSEGKKWAKNFFYDFCEYFEMTDLHWETKDRNKRDRYWTKIIMRDVLGKIAKYYKLRPYSKHHSEKGCKEYMVDMCWAKEEAKISYLDTAIEVEWDDTNKDDFLWDFSKLVDVKAYLKCFVFAPYRRNIEKWLPEFEKIIKKNPIKLESEIYSILALSKARHDETKIESYIIDKYGNSEALATKICKSL